MREEKKKYTSITAPTISLFTFLLYVIE